MDTELGFAYVIVATVVTLIVEQVRKLSDKIDGRVVNLLAWLVGALATFIPIAAFAALNDQLPDWAIEDRLAAGIVLAGLSSVVAGIKGALTNTRKLKQAALESVGRGDEGYQAPDTPRFDEGYNPGDPGYGTDRTNL